MRWRLRLGVSQHVRLLTMGVSMWTLFWVVGLPSDYFLDLPWAAQLGLIVLVPICLLNWITWLRIVHGPAAAAAAHAFWTALYFTVPFLVLDIAYLGLHQRLGWSFMASHWYLTAFYATPWLTLPLLARLRRRSGEPH